METDRSHVVATGFLALLASQIGTRILTFVINMLIARHLTPEAYGLASVQFHLLTTTALFISREGFRRGCLRFGGGPGGGGKGAPGAGARARKAGAGGGEENGRGDEGGGHGNDSSNSRSGGGSDGGGIDDRAVLRVASLTVPLGLVVTTAVCGVALWRHAATAVATSDGTVLHPEVPYYREAVVLHGAAAVLELLVEPFYILASVHLKFGSRVAVEFASTLTKSLVTLGLLAASTTATRHGGRVPPAPGLVAAGAATVPLGVTPPSAPQSAGVTEIAAGGQLEQQQLLLLPPALTFSLAQLAMAGVAAAGYWAVGLSLLAASSPGRRQPQPQSQERQGEKEDTQGTQASSNTRPGSGSRSGTRSRSDSEISGYVSSSASASAGWLSPWTPLERQVLATSAIFTLQAVEKLALAEGSKLVLATMQSAVNQGVYGLVSNLGSLVVRTLFQPLEEAAFAAFSTWGADGAAAAAATMDIQAARVRLAPVARALSPMVKAVTVLGLLAATFGPSYSYVLLRLVYGMRWSETEAPAVLAAYSVYVLLLALNGIGEAFVHAVLDTRGLQQSNALLLVFSGAHLAACVALVREYGALGLVVADGANMAMRITYSAWCIHRFFRPLPSFSLFRDLLPSTATLAAFATAAAATTVSKHLLLLLPSTAAGAMPQRVFLHRAAAHVGVGIVLLAVLTGLIARTERGVLRQVLEMRRRRLQGVGGNGEDEQVGGDGGQAAGKGAKED